MIPVEINIYHKLFTIIHFKKSNHVQEYPHVYEVS